ncbi:MAG: dTDP-4-dehydrorhamnose 3,5-epimerase [Deltaproteobacteria bacterium]|nr:dTDP-4-dehydrorhamnose 3,5-epimerase [Deltaproteobacteria bacterium]PWB62059.1 MAG: dTDP-4-dehydrorhamnose 3,5-epimerase [Deltaproteobacteria bacterium]
MKFTPTPLQGAYLVELERIEDSRGFFARSWCREEFGARGLNGNISQINVGFSGRKGTLRGMHYQVEPHAEVKVVGCTRGAIHDVIVDLRPESPTYRRWFAAELSAGNRRMLYIPERCAHGYLTLADDAEIYYLASTRYAPESARGVRYDDPAFGIEWPGPITTISEKDAHWPDFLP